MKQQKSELYFLITLLTLISILTFLIFKPFLYALILAVVFATIFTPLHNKIFRILGNRAGQAAFISTVFVLILIIIPLTFVSMQIFRESTQLYSSLTSGNGDISLVDSINNSFQGTNKFLLESTGFSLDINQYLKQGLGWLSQNLGTLFTNVGKIFIGILIFLLSLYYLFKDGSKLKKVIISLSPLNDTNDETIFDKLNVAINSVIRGSLVIALIQGALTAIGFFFFGVPNAVLWGTVASISALIPGVGTSLVTIPAIVYLFIYGGVYSALGLLLWGMLAIGLVDNFLGPKIVERGTKLHSFLILLSILGGISFFGPFGFLIGPLVLSLLFALLEIYSNLNKKVLEQ